MVVRPSPPVVALTLSLLGAGVSGYLTMEQGQGASPICPFGQGCEMVAQSTYATLGAIPTAAFGLLMYLSLAALYGVRLVSPPPPKVEQAFRLVALIVIVVGAGTSAWLTYVELYVLLAVCIWCVASAATVTLLLIAAVADILQARQSPYTQSIAE